MATQLPDATSIGLYGWLCTAASAVNTKPTFTFDNMDNDGVMTYHVGGTGGAAWQLQIFNVIDKAEETAQTGTGNQDDQTVTLDASKMYKGVLMTTGVGNRSDVAEPVLFGHTLGKV